MESLFIKNKNKLLLLNSLFLIPIFMSCIFMILGSAFFSLKAATLIGLIIFVIFYLFLVINLLSLYLIKDELKSTKKLKKSIYVSFLFIPITFFIIAGVSVGAIYITTFSLDHFYSIYFYFYFLPIAFIILNFFINFSLYKSEVKTIDEKTIVLVTTFNHDNCSICLKDTKF